MLGDHSKYNSHAQMRLAASDDRQLFTFVYKTADKKTSNKAGLNIRIPSAFAAAHLQLNRNLQIEHVTVGSFRQYLAGSSGRFCEFLNLSY